MLSQIIPNIFNSKQKLNMNVCYCYDLVCFPLCLFRTDLSVIHRRELRTNVLWFFHDSCQQWNKPRVWLDSLSFCSDTVCVCVCSCQTSVWMSRVWRITVRSWCWGSLTMSWSGRCRKRSWRERTRRRRRRTRTRACRGPRRASRSCLREVQRFIYEEQSLFCSFICCIWEKHERNIFSRTVSEAVT